MVKKQTMSATVKKKKPAKKRAYTKNLLERLKDGKPWKAFIEIDNDLAVLIATEKETSTNGGELKRIINNRLRKAYDYKKSL